MHAGKSTGDSCSIEQDQIVFAILPTELETSGFLFDSKSVGGR